MVIGRGAGRLDDKDVFATDVFVDSDKGLAIWKWLDGGFALSDSNGITDCGDEFGVE